MASELKLKALAHNKEKHPAHYYLNPFVGGPLTEAVTRLNRRENASLASKGGISSHWLGGGLLSMIRGDDELRDKVRDRFNGTLDSVSPE